MALLVNSAAMAAGEAAYFVCTPDAYTYTNTGRTVDCKKPESDQDRKDCKPAIWEEERFQKSGLSYNWSKEGSDHTAYMSINRVDGSYVFVYSGNSGHSSKQTGFCEKKTAKAKF